MKPTRYAYNVEIQERSGAWSFWNGSDHAGAAIAIAKRYARHPDNEVRVVRARDSKVIWSTLQGGAP